MKKIVIILCFLTFGCTKQPYNRFHQGLEYAAEGLAHTDRIVATTMDASLDRHQAASLRYLQEAEAACAAGTRDNCPPNESEIMEVYDHLTRGWTMLVQSIEVMRETLILAEAAAITWRETQERPENLEQICDSLGEAQHAIVRGLDVVGVDVPTPWKKALDALETVCVFVVTEFIP